MYVQQHKKHFDFLGIFEYSVPSLWIDKIAENEKTSKNVATIASRILKMDNPRLITNEFWEEIKSVAASALTQAPDRATPLYDALVGRALKSPSYKSLSDLLGRKRQSGFGQK
ncbi:MAG: hypothetical protein M3O71_01375 [Bacteroidota bacterium]|nr:hypothetical protein [Bacteroidota bacterium]